MNNLKVFIRIAKELGLYDKLMYKKFSSIKYRFPRVLSDMSSASGIEPLFIKISVEFNLFSYVYSQKHNDYINVFDDFKEFVYSNKLTDKLKLCYNLRNISDEQLFRIIKQRINVSKSIICYFFSNSTAFCYWSNSSKKH